MTTQELNALLSGIAGKIMYLGSKLQSSEEVVLPLLQNKVDSARNISVENLGYLKNRISRI